MQLRHISPGSVDWVDAMDEGGGRGWEKLAPEERSKLRVGEFSAVWERDEEDRGDYGWEEPASR
jgi:hypothetical protein